MAYELNLPIETFFLLANTPWQGENRAKVQTELDSTGVDGRAFYSQNGAIIDRYYAAFEKKRIDSSGAEMLTNIEDLLLRILFSLLWQHPEWVPSIDSVSDGELDKGVRAQLVEAIGGQEDILSGLDSLGCSDQAKWQAMMLLQKPRQQLGAVFTAIGENLPAAQAAQAKVSKELHGLLARFDELAKDTYGSWPLDLTKVVQPGAPIIPLLAAPFVVLYLEDACFCGLLCHKLFRSVGGELTKEELLVCAKALSDKSKVEILLCLKEKSLYSLEIAETIGLTPATVSHHMGILLATGFVELEKRDGKVYYQLSKAGIQKFLSGTSRLLL